MKQATALLSKRREQILQTILEQGGKAQVKLLAKLQPVRFDYQEIRLVYQVLRQVQELTGLRHCRSISVPLLPVVLETSELADLPLVRELLEHPETSLFCLKRVQMLLAGCRKLTRNRELPDFWLRLSRCRSLGDLECLHRQLTNRYNTRLLRYRVRLEEENAAQAALNDRIRQRALTFPGLATHDDRQAREERFRKQQRQQSQPQKVQVELEPKFFPPPPLDGTEFIKPILKPGGLRYEAKSEVMDNCVASRKYMQDVLQGLSYIYRVHKPERCTLEIRKNRDGTWRIAQLKTRSNGSPSSATKQFVESWLEKGNLRLRHNRTSMK